MESDYKITSKGFEREKTIKDALCTINLDKKMALYTYFKIDRPTLV